MNAFEAKVIADAANHKNSEDTASDIFFLFLTASTALSAAFAHRLISSRMATMSAAICEICERGWSNGLF